MKAQRSKRPLPPVDDSRCESSPRDTFQGLKCTDRAAREEIQHRAYAIWQSEGEPLDRDLAHWLQAEVEVMHAT